MDAAKKQRRMERAASGQCPPKTYRAFNQAQLASEKQFTPSRPLMKERIKQESVKTESVKTDLKLGQYNPNMTRKEKRQSLRNIVKRTVNDIRTLMTKGE